MSIFEWLMLGAMVVLIFSVWANGQNAEDRLDAIKRGLSEIKNKIRGQDKTLR